LDVLVQLHKGLAQLEENLKKTAETINQLLEV